MLREDKSCKEILSSINEMLEENMPRGLYVTRGTSCT
jgi:hypothetical protein